MINARRLLPLLYAAILFLTIRISNDLPQDDNYLNHTPVFIAIELTGVIVACYLCFYLAKRWVRLCVARHINPVIEYGCMLTLPLLLEAIVTAISHREPLALLITPRAFIIPTVVTELTMMWLYMFMKTSHIERLYDAQLLRNEQLRTTQLSTELRLLRSQYHPHFLFNMLNTVYFRIDESNIEARDTVEHLANLLRSQLYSGDGKVTMERELSTLDSYIRLSSLRIGDRLRLNTDIDRSLSHEEIYPHLLLPLVENAFKHCGGDYHIDISLHRTPTGLEMDVTNTIRPQSDNPATSPSGGLGLRNLRRRLELLYPGNLHTLTLHNDDNRFNAHISLTL